MYKNKQRLNSIYRKRNISKATLAEKQFEQILINLNIKYNKQKGWLKDHNTFCISDFYLPKPFKLAIEIDGEYHLTKEQQTIDKFKEDYLLNIRGIKTLRFANRLILENPQEVIKKLRDVLSKHQ